MGASQSNYSSVIDDCCMSSSPDTNNLAKKSLTMMSRTSNGSSDAASEKCSNDIPQGTLVMVKNLQSEEGKPLNGGSGVILSSPSSVIDNNLRYPVLLYAKSTQENDDQTSKLMKAPVQRSIKAENLRRKSNQMCPLFHEAANQHAAEALKAGNRKDALFWLAGCYMRWPEDFRMSLSYANILRDVCKRPKEAWAVLQRVMPHLPSTYPMMNESRYDMCLTCCEAEGKPEEALEWALQIDTDTKEHRQISMEALEIVLHYCKVYMASMDSSIIDDDEDKEKTLEIHRRAAMALLELDPMNARRMQRAAAAACLLGRNFEGSRLYRRALDTGQLRGEEMRRLKGDLSLAQMQCPGAPMEEYRAIGIADGKWACVHKNEWKEYNKFQRTASKRLSNGGPTELEAAPILPDNIKLTFFDIPDPDDPRAFGRAALPREKSRPIFSL